MNVDCRWFEEHLEAYFCDQISREEDRLARSHIETCPNCRQQVGSLYAVDPLIKRLFRHDLALARAPRRSRAGRISGVAIGAAAVAIVVLAVMLRVPPPQAPVEDVLQPVSSAPAPEPSPIVKEPDTATSNRTKPEPAADNAPASVAPSRQTALAPDENAPAFEVIDAAGYSRTLEDYRGFVLVFGVWSSDRTQAIANLERIYRTFSANTRVRILGVSNERNMKPVNTTFPAVYNQGSRLLGAAPGELFVIDGSGTVRFRGSLMEDTDTLLKSIRSALEPLGVR